MSDATVGIRSSATWQRHLAIGSFALVGSALAFVAGARVGSSIDHHTRTATVARIPVQDLAPASHDDDEAVAATPPAPADTEMARK